MGVLDSLFTTGPEALKGFNAIRGIQVCTIAYDKNHDILCWFYDLDGLGLKLIDKYYEHNNLNKFDIHIHNHKIKNRSPKAQEIRNKKICLLDDKLVTYELVVKYAETHEIKGYKPGKLKNTLNRFETIK